MESTTTEVSGIAREVIRTGSECEWNREQPKQHCEGDASNREGNTDDGGCDSRVLGCY